MTVLLTMLSNEGLSHMAGALIKLNEPTMPSGVIETTWKISVCKRQIIKVEMLSAMQDANALQYIL